LTRPPHLTIAQLWQRWLNNSLLDEFSRVEEIKGQRAANVLTAAKPPPPRYRRRLCRPARSPSWRNFDIIALDGLPSADALLLDGFAEKNSDRVWTLTAASLPHALDRGRALDELRRYLDQAASHPLPQTVTTLLDDAARRTGRLRDTGQIHLIECADEALAALVVSDRRLRALCTRPGDRHLAVSPDRLSAFRKAALTLGYPLAYRDAVGPYVCPGGRVRRIRDSNS
jgi:hypothetical protein